MLPTCVISLGDLASTKLKFTSRVFHAMSTSQRLDSLSVLMKCLTGRDPTDRNQNQTRRRLYGVLHPGESIYFRWVLSDVVAGCDDARPSACMTTWHVTRTWFRFSRLNYENVVQIDALQDQLRHPQTVQNVAIQLIFGLRRLNLISDTFLSLLWLKVPEWNEYILLTCIL